MVHDYSVWNLYVCTINTMLPKLIRIHINLTSTLYLQPVEMIDGRRFNGAKAYKDSKLCLMMTANMLHLK
ncbi:hypothetical protein EON63_16610 [archaeon]|nr:MAG: hypothetical protein EON63_16610 [archaeon]